MAKYEAVDRLMALAMEKRADRMPKEAATASQTAESIEVLGPVRASGDAAAKHIVEPEPGAGAIPAGPGAVALQPATSASHSAADRGRQFLQAIRPLLPAVASAMRLIDHGAAQTAARLLPLLGGNFGSAGSLPERAAAIREQEESHRAQQTLLESLRKDVDAANRRLASTEDLLGRTRTQLERLAAEVAGKEGETRALTDWVRLLSAGVIILLMLIVAQMILLVVMLHK